MILFNHHVQFFTATCLWWRPVLRNDYHKDILIEAWKRRVDNKNLTIYAFVIMPNHIHCMWHIQDGVNKSAFQRDLQKFTARSLLSFMKMNDDTLLQSLEVNAADRKFQVWERNPLSIDVYTNKVFFQKFNYIHNNPVRAGLSATPEAYRYSSAAFYETGKDEFGIITHYMG